jgi:hypothetical protein
LPLYNARSRDINHSKQHVAAAMKQAIERFPSTNAAFHNTTNDTAAGSRWSHIVEFAH